MYYTQKSAARFILNNNSVKIPNEILAHPHEFGRETGIPKANFYHISTIYI